MIRRRRNAAINAVPRPITDYAADPHGGALFGALSSVAANSLNGARAVVAGPMWNGWTRRVQPATVGAAGLGNGRPVQSASSELNRESSTTDANAAAIFRSRVMRGNGR